MKNINKIFAVTALSLFFPGSSYHPPNAGMAPDLTRHNLSQEFNLADKQGQDIVCVKGKHVEIFTPKERRTYKFSYDRIASFTWSWRSTCYRSQHGSDGERAPLYPATGKTLRNNKNKLG